MTTPPIMPVGFVGQRTPNGATITLAGTPDENRLKTGDHVTVWSHSPDYVATAKVLGHVTRLEADDGAFAILRAEVDTSWPACLDILETGSPVYRAVPDSFEPEMSQVSLPEHPRATVKQSADSLLDETKDQTEDDE